MTWTRIHEPIEVKADHTPNQALPDPILIIWRGKTRPVHPVHSTSAQPDFDYLELEDATHRYAIRFDSLRRGWLLEGILTPWSEGPHDRLRACGFHPP